MTWVYNEYSVEHRDGHGVLSFAKIWAVSMDKSFLTGQKTWQPMPLRLPQRRRSKKTAEAIDDLVGNRIAEKITRTASKSTREDPRKLTASQIDETSVQPTGIPKERYIPKER